MVMRRITSFASIIPIPTIITPTLSLSLRSSKISMSSNKTMSTAGSSSFSSNSEPIVIREFVSVQGGGAAAATTTTDVIRFRLVSYNILAQVYVKSSLFPHSPSPCLRWKARSQAILTLLKHLGPHFFCLQEVDEFDSFYKKNMEALGYSSIYVQRSGQKRDGCAIFYNNCAELLITETIEYNDLVDLVQGETSLSADKQNETQTNENNVKSSPENRGDPNDPHVRLKRDCVGIMAAFKLKDPFHHVVILANTHIYWDPEWADVKLAQAKYLLQRLAQFKTLVYQYLISGNSASSSSSIRCLEELPLPLCSVHASTRGEPPFTNCTPDFTNTLDYIFFSPSDCLKPVSILELPELDSPDVAGGLPNYSHPSDHLPIGAEFEITKE
ncbi:hypothetical protein REPUB_Repub03eG0248600 [Reevesia pubescens]